MAFLSVSKSLVEKHRSTIISLPSTTKFKNPESSVINQLDTMSPLRFETKVKFPVGEIASKHFAVFLDYMYYM